jgi:hypothetical protein
MSSTTTHWDRTRWDRLQASLLCVGIAVLSSLPLVLVMSVALRVQLHV